MERSHISNISTTSSITIERWRFGTYTREIIELLYREGPLMVHEIAKRLGKNHCFVHEYLRRMRKRNLLIKCGERVWDLSEFTRRNIKYILSYTENSHSNVTVSHSNVTVSLPNFMRIANDIIASFPNAEVVVDIDNASKVLAWFLYRYFKTGENAFHLTDPDSPYELAQLIGISPDDLKRNVLGLQKLGVMKLYPARRPTKIYVKPKVIEECRRRLTTSS